MRCRIKIEVKQTSNQTEGNTMSHMSEVSLMADEPVTQPTTAGDMFTALMLVMDEAGYSAVQFDAWLCAMQFDSKAYLRMQVRDKEA
jgi:hypothetical protein